MGERIAVNGDMLFQAASTIRFFVTPSALRENKEGMYGFAEIDDDLAGIMIALSNEAARNTGAIADATLSRMLIDRLTQAPREHGIEGAVPNDAGHA